MNKLYLDIETLPDNRQETITRIKLDVKPPAQYKKADSIAQWMAENAESATLETLGKTALNGLYGRVCVVGFAVNDGAVGALPMNANDTSDRELLASAFARMDELATDDHGHVMPLDVVGHNVTWDLRFLYHRAVRYGIKLPKCIAKAFHPVESRYHVHDTMTLWAGYGNRVKCKDLARELLGDDCDDIDGSQVAEYWTRDPVKVVEHCIEDVERVRKLYRMMVAVA